MSDERNIGINYDKAVAYQNTNKPDKAEKYYKQAWDAFNTSESGHMSQKLMDKARRAMDAYMEMNGLMSRNLILSIMNMNIL
ncbi:hypothetical protein MWU76_02260 [Gelidibacter sp. F2691]|nr:hypothetical protein [Gelidibacter sp. F2691]